MRARPLLGPVQAVGHGLEQHLVHERGLARARHAGDAAEHSQRDLHVHVAEVVLRGALDLHVPGGPPAPRRDGDLPLAREELPGGRARGLHDLARGALGHQMTAVLARARPQVHDVIGRHHRALVVLHDDHRVAQVAEPLQRGDQALVVALVQPDRRLVEDVEDAHERRPDLRGQPDPLRLPAGERGRGAVERQVPHAHVVEEAQPLVDLAQDEPGDLALRVGEVEALEPLDGAPGGHAGELVDPEPAHQHGQRLGPQAGAPGTPGRAGASCTPRSSPATSPNRSRGSGARDWARCPRSSSCTSAGARSGCGRRRTRARRPCRRGSTGARSRAGPPRECPCRPPTCPRSPASSARSSSTRWWTTAGWRPLRATAPGRARSAPGRSPSAIPARCSAGRRRGAS